MSHYRVIKPFSIDPFEFKVGDPVSEIELGIFKNEILASGSLEPFEDEDTEKDSE
jgi:hypothetical protein